MIHLLSHHHMTEGKAQTTTVEEQYPALSLADFGEAIFLAQQAHSKLMQEAKSPDQRLRVLVGHANMLDALRSRVQMQLELTDATRR